MWERFRRLFQIENWPLIIAFLLSLVFAVYGLRSSKLSNDTELILLVLCAITLGLLAERLIYFDRLEKATQTQGQEIKMLLEEGRRPVLEIPNSWAKFDNYAHDAEEICISGGSLSQLLHRSTHILKERAFAGCKIRIVLLDPESPALGAVAEWKGASEQQFKRELELSLGRLRELQQQMPSIEVKLNRTIPALTMMMFDADKPTGKIRLDLQHYQCDPARRPCIEIVKSPHDKQKLNLFEDFKGQFERLWAHSAAITAV